MNGIDGWMDTLFLRSLQMYLYDCDSENYHLNLKTKGLNGVKAFHMGYMTSHGQGQITLTMSLETSEC